MLIVLLALLTLAPLLGGPDGAVPMPAAYAADTTQQVGLTFTELSPALPGPDGTLTLRGTATNNTDQPVTDLQVLFWRDRTPLNTRADLASALASDAGTPLGRRMTSDGAFQTLTNEQHPELAPGESLPFEVRVKVADLGLGVGNYLIGAHALGQVGRGGNQTLGRGRTLVTVPARTVTPATVTAPTIAILSSPPSMIREGVFSDDHLSDDLSEGNRLHQLIRIAQRSDVSWAIDPNLIRELTIMSDGYQVQTPDGLQEGAGADQARAYLTQLANLPKDRGYRLLAAVPDLNTLADQPDQSLLTQSLAATSEFTEYNGLPLLAYQPGGALSNDTIPLLERIRPAAILASTTVGDQSVIGSLAGAPVIGYDADLLSGGPGPQPAGTVVQRTQRLLAEGYLTATLDPKPTQVRVLTSAEDARAEVAAQAPWTRSQPLQTLVRERPPSGGTTQFEYTAADAAAQLNPIQLGRISTLNEQYAAYLQVMVDPSELQSVVARSLLRAHSAWWRGNPTGFAGYLDPQTEFLDGLIRGSEVSVSSQPSVIMSGQTGSFPVTVTNRLDRDVQVSLVFDSDAPQRLRIDTVTDVIVPSGQSVTVPIQPRASVNGPVQVTAQVSTPGGIRLGHPIRLTVEATNFGQIGWIIVIASGLVLLAATALRIRQVTRERLAGAQPNDQPGGGNRE